MTEEEREDLIEKMAKAVVENPPDDGRNWITKWHKYSESDKKICRAAARAALAVAEPVIREECAKICDRRYMGDNNREDMEARRCAAAIREGEKDD